MPIGRRRAWRGWVVACGVFVLGGAAGAEGVSSPEGLPGLVALDALPVPGDPVLSAGREVWGGLCVNCHNGNRYTGAPKITSTDAWSPRIDKGFSTLLDHAANGFIGPKFTEMPPRGGNPDLTDAEVAAAVAFMVWASGGATDALAYVDSIDFPRD